MAEMSVKAFELSSVIEKVMVGERIRIKIECIEFRAKSLYLGTNDSFVIQLIYNSTKKRCEDSLHYKYLALKKPIVILRAICILERILCVCDSNLFVLNQNDLEMVSYGKTLKNISSLCLNENPNNNNPFSVQLCIARRKQLIVYNMTSEKMIALKEVSLAEFVLSLSMDGQYICVGTDTQFLIVDWETSRVQDLCSSDSEIAVPVSKRITKEEFLITGPSSLGLFVKSTGVSERPPLQWSSDIISIAYSHPYILCLSDRSVCIFSVVDQQLKQQIPFNGGIYLDNFDGNILISTIDSVFELSPIEWQKQLQMLLSARKVKEALDLSHNWREAGLSQESYDKVLLSVKRDAAFVELSLKHFEDTKQLLIDSNADILELIDLFPDLLPQSLKPKTPFNHFIDNLCLSFDENNEDFEEYKLFLLEFLEQLYENKCEQYMCRELEVNCALICLYLQYKTYSEKLSKVLIECNLNEVNDWVIERLHQTQAYHMSALFYSTNKSTFDKAIDIWIKLETKEYSDDCYPGLQCFADFLSGLEDEQIVFKHLDFILERDQSLGAKVLINRKNTNNESVDHMIGHLHRYTVAEMLYLEHLIFTIKIQSERLHTNLALKYINHLVTSDDIESEEVKDLRIKLRILLRESTLYITKVVLEKAIEGQLHYESAILYGRLGEHKTALSIFVQQLHDYQLAQQYCLQLYSGTNELSQRHQLFHTLLDIYLNLSQSNSDSVSPALQLLNSQVTEFDTIRVLQLIPQNWSLSTVHQFLNKAIRQSIHGLRQSLITKGLATTENRVVRHQRLVTQRQSLLLNEHRTTITEPQFLWFPSLQILLHPHCGKGLSNRPLALDSN